MFRNPVTDLIVVALIALVIFGPKRLPMLGRALGHGLREFKEGITGESKHDEGEERPALTQAPTADLSREPTAAAAPPATPGERESAEAAAPEPRS